MEGKIDIHDDFPAVLGYGFGDHIILEMLSCGMSTAKEVADAFQSIDIAFDRNRFLSRLLLFIGKAGCTNAWNCDTVSIIKGVSDLIFSINYSIFTV